jgi:enoyl-CoA hydratase
VSTVSFATTGRVGVITMDDGKANAMNDAFFGGIHDALDRALATGVRCVVFRGNAKFYSAGLDLKLIPTLPPEELVGFAARFGECMLRIFGFELPTVAAIEGHAVGGGAILAFACDHRVARDGRGSLQLNETAIGIALPSWAIAITQSAVSARWHSQLMLRARRFRWAEAAAAGLVDDLVPEHGDLDARTTTVANDLSLIDRAAYAETKRRLRSAAIQEELERLESELRGQLLS